MFDESQWYCLRSDALGQLVLQDIAVIDGVLQQSGAVLVFQDATDAERAAVEHRESYPTLLIQAVPLPATPPKVPSIKHHYGQRTTTSIQMRVEVVGLPSQVLDVEVRIPLGSQISTVHAASRFAEHIRRRLPVGLKHDRTRTIDLGMAPAAPELPLSQEKQ